MSFHLTAEDIRIEDGHFIRANLRNEAGEMVFSEVDLNAHIGNENGHFKWDSSNFSETAENIRFDIEGGGQVPVLRAALRGLDGEMYERDLNLAERIENHDGRFHFVQ